MCMNGVLVVMKWKYDGGSDSLPLLSMWDSSYGVKKQTVWHCELETIKEEV